MLKAKRKRETDREQQRRIDEGIGKYFSANTATAPVKQKQAATAEDTAFLDDLLGEVSVNVVASRPSASRRAIKDQTRRKTRVLSPPLSGSRRRYVDKDISQPVTAMQTPPRSDDMLMNDDGFNSQLGDDNDTQMSDPVLPSSPVARAVERKAQAPPETQQIGQQSVAENGEDYDDDDDDAMEVLQVQGHAGAAPANVNMAGSRPALKPKKAQPAQAIDDAPASSSPTRPPPEAGLDPSTLNKINDKLNVVSSPAGDTALPGKLATQDALEEDGSLNFFWMDHTELNGSLLLFGKVKNKQNNTHVSCFVKVDNILRKLFFLPREHRHKNGHETDEEVEMGDVYTEVDELMSRLRVGMHKMKPCTRKYAFELSDVPAEGDYLKLLYPYDKPALGMDVQGETFSRVFGTNTSLFEQFVLWKNIMGPCWLKIRDADFTAVHNASWCKLEVSVGKPADICPLGDSDNLEAPPLTLMSLALRTSMNQKENKQEIIMISARIYENIALGDTTPAEKLPCKTLTIMRPPGDSFPTGFKVEVERHKGTVKLERTEQGLLSLFLAQLQRIDPDVLVGHRLEDLDYSVLLSRLRERKTPGWHRIGRLKRSEWPKNIGKGGGSFFTERQLVAGRLLCDLGNDMGKVRSS